MANTIKLNEGLEPLDVVFEDRGEVVRIHFNPRDTDLALRIMQSQDNIRAAVEALPEGEDDAAKLEQVNGVIRAEIDRIFGAKVSDGVFKFCGPLTPDKDGVTFVERFLAAVAPYIVGRIDEANKASAARIAKHTAKYTKTEK